MPAASFPKILMHCTVAIYNGDSLKGVADPKDRMEQAFMMARASLTKYGYLSGGSAMGPVSKITLTAKGAQREAKHMREPGGYAKTVEFTKLYRLLETQDPPARPKLKGVDKPMKQPKIKGQVLKMSNRKLPFK